MIHKHKSTGFTLVELMLSMTFISFLLLAIAFLTIHISGIYNKGISLKSINESGLSLSEDMQRTIASAPPFNLGQDTAPKQYTNIIGRGGRLCVGTYSYAWNYAPSLQDGGSPLNEYAYPDNATPIRFIKVRDPQGTVCTEASTQVAQKSLSTELLGQGDRDLLIYAFTVSAYSNDVLSSQALYAVDFTLGTGGGSILEASNTQCVPPSDGNGYADYCAVNNFSIIIRASSVKGGS